MMTTATVSAPFDRATLASRLEAAWRRSDLILGMVAEEAMLKRPIALRQPFIFYVGHLPAFAWNQVMGGLLERPGPQGALDALFARGIDPVGVDSFDGEEQWPGLDATLAYRDRVRDALLNSFDAVEALAGRDLLAARGRVYNLVIEHELMHHETLLYMIHQLDRGMVRQPAEVPPPVRGPGSAERGLVAVPGASLRLGASFEGASFGWDNEFPAHEVEVAPFEISRTAVSNSEWLEFIAAGGYVREELWSAEAWAWRRRTGHDHPVFWRRDGKGWKQATLFQELPIEEVGGWPVYVSWAEAEAYARWKGGRLPTEAEFHAAADLAAAPWGDPTRGNFDFTHWAPVPAGHYGAGGSAPVDLVGNGWEWTRTRFGPFRGFEAWARTYPGYSADFFDEQHHVMLGASWATDRALARRSFRNWFQPHYPFVFAKFRLVRQE
jgi:ergothioneine biosynthesis protein EgtB